MKQVIQSYRTGELAVAEVPSPRLPAGGVLIATRASLVSAGTEKMLLQLAKASLAGKALARPDLVRQVVAKARREGIGQTLSKVRSRLETPIPLGYSAAGRVLEVGPGIDHLRPGERVAAAGAGYANHAGLIAVPKHLCVAVPQGVSDEAAAFATVGAIALQGVRQAAPTLGERVVVIGLGLIGLLTVQLLKANGCRVLGQDPDPARVGLARELGADLTVTDDLAAAATGFTRGRGADSVLVTASTPSHEPVNLAAEIARPKGTLVLVGMVGMNLTREPFYKKELNLRLSMSYGPGRYDPAYEEQGQDYPFAHVRWTEQRNLEAFLDLVAAGRVTPEKLITHRFPIAEAEQAYQLMEGRDPYLGILLTYPDTDPATAREDHRINLKAPVAIATDQTGIGFIGAGNFARSVLLPTLAKLPGHRLTGVVTATGMSAAEVAKRFGFRFATTDYREILNDPATNAVVIATRHDRHSALACAALEAGKAVFVEKPLAIDRVQLDALIAVLETTGGRLQVGFNRRFSPLLQQARAALDGRNSPLVMTYRVNAGVVPDSSWIQQAEGGGRIVGEVCHFVDVFQFLTAARPVEVFARSVPGYADAVSIQIGFDDGSLGTIIYTALGDPGFPKESLEVFSHERVIAIDDYLSARFVVRGRARKVRLRGQDKGFAGELQAFLDAVRSGGPMAIPPDSLIDSTLATFAIEDSLATGLLVRL